MTPERAAVVVAEWERDHPEKFACEFFRSGDYNIQHGEHDCSRCHVPLTVHRAYRWLVKAVPQHG